MSWHSMAGALPNVLKAAITKGLNPLSAKHWTCSKASVVLGAAWVHPRCNQARGCALRTQLHVLCARPGKKAFAVQ